jgi:predicted ATPase
VCNRDKAVGSDVVEPLGSFLEQSLLRREDGSHEPRFGMLESMREYALERLEQWGEEEALREAHAHYFVTVAEEAYGRRLDDESAWAARLEAERDNLRAALDWLAANDPSGHLQLAGALGWYWHTHSRFVEGRERLAEALRLGVGSPRNLARALTAAGTLAGRQGDTGRRPPHAGGGHRQVGRAW